MLVLVERHSPSDRRLPCTCTASLSPHHDCAGFNPPPVSDTKAAFLQKYPRPLPGIYDTVIQELLVQQHLIRFQKKYQYDKVTAAHALVGLLRRYTTILTRGCSRANPVTL